LKRKTLEEEINLFLQEFGCDELIRFFDDVVPLMQLYNVTADDDWVRDALIDEEEVMNVRAIRTVYLLSKIAERHAGKLCSLKINYKDLWKRLEKAN